MHDNSPNFFTHWSKETLGYNCDYNVSYTMCVFFKNTHKEIVDFHN